MFIIGLTGGIAAGKTSVSTYLSSLGAHILCADEIARAEAMSPRALEKIERAFGPEMIFPNGTLNRKALGERIFADEDARKVLDAIMHPEIIASVKAKLAQMEMMYPQDVAVVDAALLIETGMADMFDEVWLVRADDDTRLSRLMGRDSVSAEQARLRMAAQMPEREKARFASDIIDNNGDWDETRAQIDALWRRLEGEPSPFGQREHVQVRARAEARREQRLAYETARVDVRAAKPGGKKRLKTALTIAALLIALSASVAIWLKGEMERRTYKLEYPGLILQYAEEYRLDPILVASVIHVESGNRREIASPKGAVGLMQIMPATGEWIAEKLNMKDYKEDMLTDPEINIQFGCWYLRFLQDRFQNTDEVLAAYNAGQGNVQKWLSNPGLSDDGVTLSQIPFKETEQYVERIQRAYIKYRSLYKDAWKGAVLYEKAYAS